MKTILAFAVVVIFATVATAADYTDVIRYQQQCFTDANGRMSCRMVPVVESVAATAAPASPCPCVTSSGSCPCAGSAVAVSPQSSGVSWVAAARANGVLFPRVRQFFAAVAANRPRLFR